MCCIGVAGKALSFAQKEVGAPVKAGSRELINTVTKVSDVGADVVKKVASKLTGELPDNGAGPFSEDMASVPIQRSLFETYDFKRFSFISNTNIKILIS